jgi:hypothetical protein
MDSNSILQTEANILYLKTLQDRDGTAVPSRSCSKAVYKPV